MEQIRSKLGSRNRNDLLFDKPKKKHELLFIKLDLFKNVVRCGRLECISVYKFLPQWSDEKVCVCQCITTALL